MNSTLTRRENEDKGTQRDPHTKDGGLRSNGPGYHSDHKTSLPGTVRKQNCSLSHGSPSPPHSLQTLTQAHGIHGSAAPQRTHRCPGEVPCLLGPRAGILPCAYALAQAFPTFLTLESEFPARTGYPCALSPWCISRRKQNGNGQRQR